MTYYINNEDTQPRLERARPERDVVSEPVPVARRRTAIGSVRRFSYVLLATFLSMLIVVADRLVDAWSSGGLLLALAALWLALMLPL